METLRQLRVLKSEMEGAMDPDILPTLDAEVIWCNFEASMNILWPVLEKFRGLDAGIRKGRRDGVPNTSPGCTFSLYQIHQRIEFSGKSRGFHRIREIIALQSHAEDILVLCYCWYQLMPGNFLSYSCRLMAYTMHTDAIREAYR